MKLISKLVLDVQKSWEKANIINNDNDMSEEHIT